MPFLGWVFLEVNYLQKDTKRIEKIIIIIEVVHFLYVSIDLVNFKFRYVVYFFDGHALVSILEERALRGTMGVFLNGHCILIAN